MLLFKFILKYIINYMVTVVAWNTPVTMVTTFDSSTE